MRTHIVPALIVGAALCPTPTGAAAAEVFVGDVTLVATGFRFTEGPVWVPAKQTLLFSDIPANRIHAVTPEGEVSVWREDSGNANGLTLDGMDRLIACEHGNRRVSRTLADGTVEAIAERWEGARFNSPNDVAVRSDGTLFFTDPPYGLSGRPAEIAFHGVFRVRPGEAPVCLARDFARPNGLAFSPDEQRLYIADTERNHVRVFEVSESGDLGTGSVLAAVTGPDGMKVDTAGRLFVTSRDGMVVLSPDGSRLAVLPCPEIPANCAFGDGDAKTLYITARRGVYRVRTALPGILPGSRPSQHRP